MKDNNKIDSLARPNCKSGKILFIHTDGKEHSFSTCINDLSGDRLSYFDFDPPYVNSEMKWIKSVFRDIKNKAKVISCIGDF